MKFPEWYKSSESNNRIRYLLAVCALNLKENCTQAELLASVGMAPAMAGHWMRSGSVPIRHAMAIEKLVGRDVMPWEVLVNPMYDWEEK